MRHEILIEPWSLTLWDTVTSRPWTLYRTTEYDGWYQHADIIRFAMCRKCGVARGLTKQEYDHICYLFLERGENDKGARLLHAALFNSTMRIRNVEVTGI